MRKRKNPISIGTAGMLLIVLALAVVVAAPRAYLLMRTDEYTAEFANAAGLQPGGRVHVAGVPAGNVMGVEIAGDRVFVKFRLNDGQALGRDTSASVKIATIMGNRYLAIDPAGPGRLEPGGVIPRSRTSVPYSLDELGNEASHIVKELDLRGMQEMMSTLQAASSEDPALLGQTLVGVTRAAETVTRHELQIGQLSTSAQRVSTTLSDQQAALVKPLGDADLARTTNHDPSADRRCRRPDHRTRRFLRRELGEVGTAADRTARRQRDVGPQRQGAHRDDRLARPRGQGLANATGNGTWGDVAGPAGPLPDNLLCLVGLAEGCRWAGRVP